MRTTALLAALALSSCSLIGTRRPDPPPYLTRPDCNQSLARPVIDTSIGGAGLALAGIGAITIARPATGPDDSGKDLNGAVWIAAGSVVAGVFLTSAIIGYPRVRACADAVAEWEAAHPDERPPETPDERLARQYLRCPLDALTTRELEFAGDDERRETHPWAQREITGCGRVVWCGEQDQRAKCGAPADLEFAVHQLAVETGCPAQTIEQLEFYAVTTQHTYRLNACGIQFSCIVPIVKVTQGNWNGTRQLPREGAAGSAFGSQLTCKPAQTLVKPALEPETPADLGTPPPPPSQP